jgi:hypothetical protein
MLSLLVFDDWLTAERLEAVHRLSEAHFRSRPAAGTEPVFSWYSPKQRRHVSRVSRELRAVAEAYIDDLVARLTPLLGHAAEGYEWWSNFGNTLNWHKDKDETLFEVERKLATPRWSTVFYPQVSIRGRGGELSLLSPDARAGPYLPELSSDEIPGWWCSGRVCCTASTRSAASARRSR